MNTGSDSHSSDSDAWRSRSATDGMRNGDAGSSSLAAKGFRSVRPNLQDKKSPTPVPLPPSRRESYQVKPPGVDPPSYGSLAALAGSLVPDALSLVQSAAGDTQEGSYTVSTHTKSSYSYSKKTTSISSSSSSVALPAPTDPNPSAQNNEHSVPTTTTATTTTNSSRSSNSTQVQLRRVATLQLTPTTAPDPPTHNTPAEEEHPSTNSDLSGVGPTSNTTPTPTPPSRRSSINATAAPIASSSLLETRKSSLSIQINPLSCSTGTPKDQETPKDPRMTPPIPPRPSVDMAGQMAMNGRSAHVSSPPSVPQRPLSPPAYPPPPPTLSPGVMRVQQNRSSESSESVMRESVVTGETTVSSTVPIARFSEEEKKVSVIKAPHYEGIGPVDESGIPIAIRTTVDRPKDWYKTMFKQIHMVHKPDDDYPETYNATYTIVNNDNYNMVHAHPPPRTHTYRPLAKPVATDDGGPPLREPSPAPIPPPPPPMPSLLQLRSRDYDRERDMPHDMNEYSPPDRKVDTRKYRAEPRSIFEYEPGKSSILEQERPTYDINPDDIDLENEPWYKFFSELEFGRPVSQGSALAPCPPLVCQSTKHPPATPTPTHTPTSPTPTPATHKPLLQCEAWTWCCLHPPQG
ncbi:hypothetical protein ACEWY4_007291 [Coilia grayii]|uniref:SoHo domain-containing protein n=1 Tax=Coilia grayii TaxID=363190 RepID=A0ABD1KFV4_9TELE